MSRGNRPLPDLLSYPTRQLLALRRLWKVHARVGVPGTAGILAGRRGPARMPAVPGGGGGRARTYLYRQSRQVYAYRPRPTSLVVQVYGCRPSRWTRCDYCLLASYVGRYQYDTSTCAAAESCSVGRDRAGHGTSDGRRPVENPRRWVRVRGSRWGLSPHGR